MEVSVLADGDEERQVEHNDEGGEGGVTGDPDPLQVPGKLFPNLDIHLKALSLSPPVQKLELDHKSLISAALIFKILKNNHYILYFLTSVVQLASFLSLELCSHFFFMLQKTWIFMTSFQDPIGLTLMNLCMRAPNSVCNTNFRKISQTLLCNLN